ncbi:MAG: hypothetical protein H8F28_14630 [Fibrella sp.]|nr:hypothetical protein [Armatimonadota bacterium]
MTADETAPDGATQPDDGYEGPLLSFADFMNVLGDHGGVVTGVAEQDTGVRMTVTELAYDLPMELRVRTDAGGGLVLRGGPPTQRVETTIFPVLHRIRVRLARTEETLGESAPDADEGVQDGAYGVR